MSYGNHSNDFLLVECQYITLFLDPTTLTPKDGPTTDH